MDDNNKAFPGGNLYFERRHGVAGEVGWAAGGMEGGGGEGTGMDERRRGGAVSHRFEASLQFMTRVGLRGTSRTKGG